MEGFKLPDGPIPMMLTEVGCNGAGFGDTKAMNDLRDLAGGLLDLLDEHPEHNPYNLVGFYVFEFTVVRTFSFKRLHGCAVALYTVSTVETGINRDAAVTTGIAFSTVTVSPLSSLTAQRQHRLHVDNSKILFVQIWKKRKTRRLPCNGYLFSSHQLSQTVTN
jgi:hypothetical protein